MGTKSQNHYEVLGLWRDASDADIRRSYRHLTLLYHPDVSPESGAAERFRAIQEAYNVLIDPAARASFDASLGVDVGSGRARPRTTHDAGTSSGRRASPLRSDGVPDDWTRALAAEARNSWKTLSGFLTVLALAIAACALIDRISGIGTVAPWLYAVFVLPLLVFFIFLLQWAHVADGSAKRRAYRGRL